MQSNKSTKIGEGVADPDAVKASVAVIGNALRKKIREHKEETGRSYRHLSEAIGRDPNYVASYLSKESDVWAIPKHPTYQKLLKELNVTELELTQAEKGGVSDA